MSSLNLEDLDLLCKLPMFSGLSPDILDTLLLGTKIREHPAGEVLFLQGDEADRFYVIFSGWVKLYRETPDGDQFIIAVFARGESFAEAAIFDKGDFPVCAEVVEDARLLEVRAQPFLHRLQDDSSLALNILASMSRRLRYHVALSEQFRMRTTAQRLAEFLLKLCPSEDGETTITLPYDKSLVAGRLGMEPETFSRALAKLRPLGVTSKRHEVHITDTTALRDLVASED
jgi:CRP-like cAMP-binding protein